MGLSLSAELILGLILGSLLTLFLQQLFKASTGMGRWLPLVFLIAVVIGGVLLFFWLRG